MTGVDKILSVGVGGVSSAVAGRAERFEIAVGGVPLVKVAGRASLAAAGGGASLAAIGGAERLAAVVGGGTSFVVIGGQTLLWWPEVANHCLSTAAAEQAIAVAQARSDIWRHQAAKDRSIRSQRQKLQRFSSAFCKSFRYEINGRSGHASRKVLTTHMAIKVDGNGEQWAEINASWSGCGICRRAKIAVRDADTLVARQFSILLHLDHWIGWYGSIALRHRIEVYIDDTIARHSARSRRRFWAGVPLPLRCRYRCRPCRPS